MALRILAPLLSPFVLGLASCGMAASGESTPQAALATTEVARFDEPWAMAIDPGTGTIFVTEKAGGIRFVRPDGRIGTVSGVPAVDHGGQGGLGDIAFAPGEPRAALDRRTIYLTWAEAGEDDTRGAALGRGEMVCEESDSCRIEQLRVIWRQAPKVTGRGHYSHRIAFSPDGKFLFLSSGDRQKMTPAQDLSNTLGKVLRLLPDGTPAPGNPFARRGGIAAQIWSYGHRNVLGLAFDGEGQLWDLEHGPAGGDEINRVEPGRNFGWPLVSQGDHYDGTAIPRHNARPDIAAPAIAWNPVIAPGDFVFHSGRAFPQWRGQALVAAMKPAGVVRVAVEGGLMREVARHPTAHRIRDIAEAPDGTLWLLEDGKERGGGHLLRVSREVR